MGKILKVLITGFIIVILGSMVACGNKPVSTTTPTVTGPQTKNLVDGNISVTAETNFDYAFDINKAMKNVKVTGNFKTFGGAPNHIEVYIMDDATYTNWLKGRTVHILFDSGLMSSGTIDQDIVTPGKYHLVFTNYAKATLSPAQQVTTKVDLNWVY